MKGKNILLTLAIIAVILAGCEQGGQGTEGDTSTGVYIGTQSIEIQYREGLPYSPVTIDDKVDIGVEVKNYGAEDLTGGKIMVEGITSTNVAVQSLTVEGKDTSGRSYGGPEYITFENIPIEGDQSIIVTACYPYKTKLVKNFCYDPTIGTQTREEVCSFQTQNAIKDGQGAPIAVTNVQIDRRERGDKAKLIITLENKGTGNIRTPSKPTIDCDGQVPTQNDINRIRIDKATFSGKTGNCNPTVGGLVVMENGKAVVSCEYAGMGTTTSQRQLDLELSYGYVSQSKIKEIKVET